MRQAGITRTSYTGSSLGVWPQRARFSGRERWQRSARHSLNAFRSFGLAANSPYWGIALSRVYNESKGDGGPRQILDASPPLQPHSKPALRKKEQPVKPDDTRGNTNTMTYQSINPYDGALLQTFEEFTAEQLEAAIATAETCFQTWRHTSFKERAHIVAKVAELMNARVDALARLVTLEMGKRIDEARGEVEFSAKILSYYAKNAERFLAPVKLHPAVGAAHKCIKATGRRV